jgi:dynein heavy chain 1
MDFTRLRALTSMYTLLNKGILNVIDNTILRSNLDLVQRYLPAQLLFSIMWGFGGSMALRERETFSRYICTLSSISTPDQSESSPPLLDYSIKFEDNCGWRLWNTYVAKVEVSCLIHEWKACSNGSLDRDS